MNHKFHDFISAQSKSHTLKNIERCGYGFFISFSYAPLRMQLDDLRMQILFCVKQS